MKTVSQIIEQGRKEIEVHRTSLPDCLPKTSQLVSKFGNLVSFIKEFNPDAQIQFGMNKEVAYFCDTPTLATIRAEYGTNAAIVWLVPQIKDLSEYCGCKGKITDSQMEQCAGIIAMTYPFLKVSELMLFFVNFKAGQYGKFYGSVDPLTITTALREFIKERAAAFEKHEREERERADAEYKKTAITYDEYLSMNGIKISKAAESSKPAKPTTTPPEERKRNSEDYTKSCAENLISNAYHCKPDDLKMMRDMFKNKYGCTPEEYIEKEKNNANQTRE